MGNYMSILRELILLVTLASIFAVLVVTILKIIKRAAFYSGKTGVLMAVSLSLLFLVALSQFLVGPGDVYHTVGSDGGVKATSHSLPPGIALVVAAAVVLSQIFLLASKTSQDEKPEHLAKETERPDVKNKSLGRPKKEPAEKQSKDMTKTAGSPSRKENEKAPTN